MNQHRFCFILCWCEIEGEAPAHDGGSLGVACCDGSHTSLQALPPCTDPQSAPSAVAFNQSPLVSKWTTCGLVSRIGLRANSKLYEMSCDLFDSKPKLWWRNSLSWCRRSESDNSRCTGLQEENPFCCRSLSSWQLWARLVVLRNARHYARLVWSDSWSTSSVSFVLIVYWP